MTVSHSYSTTLTPSGPRTWPGGVPMWIHWPTPPGSTLPLEPVPSANSTWGPGSLRRYMYIRCGIDSATLARTRLTENYIAEHIHYIYTHTCIEHSRKLVHEAINAHVQYDVMEITWEYIMTGTTLQRTIYIIEDLNGRTALSDSFFILRKSSSKLLFCCVYEFTLKTRF